MTHIYVIRYRMERNLWASFTLTQDMFLILSVKSAAELVISVQDMRNINQPDKGDYTGKCEFKKKRNQNEKLKLSPWKWKERILNFLSELCLVCIFECICHALYTQRTNINQVIFIIFFRLRQETNKKEDIKSSFFSLLLCSFWLWWSDFKDYIFFPARE